MNQVSQFATLSDQYALKAYLDELLEAVNQGAAGQLHGVVTFTDTGTANVGETMILVAPSGAMTVNIPGASLTAGTVITVKRINTTTHTVTIDAADGNLDGAATDTLTTSLQSKSYVSDGANYHRVHF